MGVLRHLLLAGSRSRWLREQATRHAFVRRAVSRFMPGERLEDALAAASGLRPAGIGAVLTCLGENVAEESAADEVARHYEQVLDRVDDLSACEISVKPTQLGLDLDHERCFGRLQGLVAHAALRGNFVWVDMEQSRYVDLTLALVRRVRAERANVGVCVQSYLRRTPADLPSLLDAGIGVRLVKGAYDEPSAVAFPDKKQVDGAYAALGRRMLERRAGGGEGRVVFGTHDERLIRALLADAEKVQAARGAYEFHLLYGIQRPLQQRLAQEGHGVRVLISYGDYWFPWYMRRLAERPANVLFVAKSLMRP